MATKSKKTNNSKVSSGVKKGVVGLAAVTAAAAIAGSFFVYGKDADKNRKKAKGKVQSWSLKAKGEILEQMEKARSLSKDEYEDIVDKVMLKYQALKNVDKSEMAIMADELKKHWVSIHGQVKKEEAKLKSQKTRKPTRKSTKK